MDGNGMKGLWKEVKKKTKPDVLILHSESAVGRWAWEQALLLWMKCDPRATVYHKKGTIKPTKNLSWWAFHSPVAFHAVKIRTLMNQENNFCTRLG